MVECGSGLSTVVLARCLQINGEGHVYSMEHMPEFAQVTREELQHQGLAEWATVLDAPLVAHNINGQQFQWYQVDQLPTEPFDLLIVDGPPARTGPTPRYPAGQKLFARLSPRATIFIDDAARPEERAVIGKWQMEFSNIRFEINADDFQKGACIARRTATVTSISERNMADSR